MSTKAKKKLTTKQEQTKHRALQYTAVGGMYASLLTPFIVLGAVHFNEWFAHEEGWKVGLGFTLSLAVMGIAVALVTKKKEKESTLTNGWITFIVIWLAVAIIFKLLSQIYDEIFGIMLWTALGLAGAFGLDIVSKKEKEKADAYKDARAKAMGETIKEKAMREVEKEEAEKNDEPLPTE